MSRARTRDDEDRPRAARDGRARDNGRAPMVDVEPGTTQASWFGLADDRSTTGSVYAGIVFNRPIEQILTYHVPVRFAGLIRVGQRVRAPLGRGDKLASGYCVRVERQAPEGLDPSRIKDLVEILDPLPL